MKEFKEKHNTQFFPQDFTDRQDVSLEIDSSLMTHHTTSYVVTANNLVSAVGGGLGLFMGFSILSTLSFTYNYLDKKVKLF